jgi:hypothetical protein
MTAQMAHFRPASIAALRSKAAALFLAILVLVAGDNNGAGIGLMGVVLSGDSCTCASDSSDDTSTVSSTASDTSTVSSTASDKLALPTSHLALRAKYLLTNSLCL